MANVIITKETANISDEKNIRLWQTRITGTIEWVSKHWNGWESWKAAYLLDRAIHWGKAEALSAKSQDLDSEVTVPLIANHIRNLMPFLFSSDPVFYGAPPTGKTEDIERTVAQLDYLNHVWEEHNMSKQTWRTVLDAAIIGHGIIKTGWGLTLGDLPKTTDPEKEGEINYLDYVTEEGPYCRRINPFSFLFDRMSPDSDLSSARWCCEFIMQTVQDLLDNDLYDKELREKIGSGEVPIYKVLEFNKTYHKEDSGGDQNDFLFAQSGIKEETGLESPDTLCILYKVYDRKFGNVFTLIPEDFEHILAVDKWDDTYNHLRNFPFVKVDFEEVPNEVHGIGHVRYLADIQAQTNRNRSKIYAITRMFNPKYVHKGTKSLDVEEANKVTRDEPGSVVNLKPDASLDVFPTPKVSEDLYRAAQMQDKDYSELSGEDVLARGGLLPSRTSAEEVRERRRLRGLRLETNVKNTHDFVLQVGDHVLRHAQRYLSKSLVVQIIGRKGEFWSNIAPEQLKLKGIRLKLELISKAADPPEVKRKNLMELFNIIANPNIYQLLQQTGVQVNMPWLWKELMKTYNYDELQQIFPGLDELTLPPIDLVNQGNQPAVDSGNQQPQSTTDIQQDNVAPESSQQGIEALLAQATPGTLDPTKF